MFLVRWIADCFGEVSISGHSTDVLRRTRILPVQAQRPAQVGGSGGVVHLRSPGAREHHRPHCGSAVPVFDCRPDMRRTLCGASLAVRSLLRRSERDDDHPAAHDRPGLDVDGRVRRRERYAFIPLEYCKRDSADRCRKHVEFDSRLCGGRMDGVFCLATVGRRVFRRGEKQPPHHHGCMKRTADPAKETRL